MAIPTINRTAVFVYGKDPFLEWIKNTSDPNDSINWTLEMVNDEPFCFLMKEYDTPTKTDKHLHQLKPDLFEAILNTWMINPSTWPEERTREKFDRWFDIHYSTVVYDFEEGKQGLLHDG